MLKLGDKNTDVAKAQILLWSKENPLTIDGDFGQKTKAAVEDFQKSQTLPVTGEIDDKTFDRLRRFKFLKDIPFLRNVDLEPSNQKTFTSPNLTKSYNNYGKLVFFICLYLGLEEAVAHSIIAVESAGAKTLNGRPTIRFENHIFMSRLSTTTKVKNFVYDQAKPWLGHKFTKDGVNWIQQHTDQNSEWDAFEFAKTIDSRAAHLSISIGPSQMMGFNHKKLGYNTPEEMLQIFSQSDRWSVLALFDFVRSNTNLNNAMYKKDFKTFAYYYNGPGQVDLYKSLLTKVYISWK